MHSLASPACALIVCGVTAAVGVAEPTADEWARVMNLSGRQRMLTQKMSRDALFITVGIRAEELRAELAETAALFEATHVGLRDGDPSLGLPGAENQRLIEQIDKIQPLYFDLKTLLETVTHGGDLDRSALQGLADKNVRLLREVETLVSMFQRQAKKVLRGHHSAAVVINLSGKQRMLTQKMVKEALLIHLGVDADKSLSSLRKSTELFDRTLTGLLNGDDRLNLPGAENANIRAQLDRVRTLWWSVSDALDVVLQGGALSDERLATLLEDSDELLDEMDTAVRLFEQWAD